MQKKICLFTAHSPLSGGGSVIIHSLIDNISELAIDWYYTASLPAKGYEVGYCGQTLMGGSFLYDIAATWKLLSLHTSPELDSLINKLLHVDCDAYWIVSHNEGLRVAWELIKRQSSRPVHLTIHDDWAGALCARSIRYRAMSFLAKELTCLVLKVVPTFDVVSYNMQSYYSTLVNRTGEICHRYLPAESIESPKFTSVLVDSIIQVGHIGSIYDKKDFIQFLHLFNEFSQLKEKQPIVHMWGCHLNSKDIPLDLRPSLKLYASLPETNIISELAKCNFVYSMYPTKKSLSIFSKTSLPTKLTSYIQTRRPIFGHGPLGSTLADFIRNTETGVFWNGKNIEDGVQALEDILSKNLSPQIFLRAQAQYFGEENLHVVRQVFSN